MKSVTPLSHKEILATVHEIQEVLRANASEKAIIAAKKFVPGAEKIYGVRNPILNDLAKKYKYGSFELVKKLWENGSYEERMLAAKMLGKIASTNAKRSFEMILIFAEEIDNWAVCDTIGMQSLQPLRSKYANEIFALANNFVISENYWKRRLSLVLVEWYTRDKKFHEQINYLLHTLKKDNEYYVKKAIDWILRNMQKEK